MAEICQKVPDGFGMPVEWTMSRVSPIFKGKGGIWNHSRYRAEKLLEHGMKVVKMALKKRLLRIVFLINEIWLYARERNNCCCVYLEKDARSVSCQRKKVVCVLWT